MMNKRELAKAYDAGQLEVVARELGRYGTIEDFARWEAAGVPERITHYRHHARRWYVTTRGGEVESISWELI